MVEQGQVVEQGGHEELILAKGRYADLWSKQVFLSPVDNDDSSQIKVIDNHDDKSSELTALSEGENETVNTAEESAKMEASNSSQNKEVDSAKDSSSLADSNLTL